MSMSLDFLNTVYDDLAGPVQTTFYRQTHLLDALQGNKKKAVGGNLIVRPFATTTPAQGIAIRTGDEQIPMTRRETITDKLQVDLHRLAVALNIPNRELDRATSKKAILDLAKHYIGLTMEGMRQDFESWFFQGISSGKVWADAELIGLMTLNGQKSYSGAPTGTANGILDFVIPSSQSDSVQSVTKSLTKGLYNQYADISSWAADGEAQWRATFRKCAQLDPMKKGPNLMVCDDATFGNYQQGKHDLVRVTAIQDNPDKGSDVLADVFQTAKVVTSSVIDLANFTGVAADGVTFMLNTKKWEMHELKPFQLSRFESKIANQDVVTSVGVWEGQLICLQYSDQAVISGGAA